MKVQFFRDIWLHFNSSHCLPVISFRSGFYFKISPLCRDQNECDMRKTKIRPAKIFVVV